MVLYGTNLGNANTHVTTNHPTRVAERVALKSRERGKGGAFYLDGHADAGGRLPVNTTGGGPASRNCCSRASSRPAPPGPS